MDAARYLINPAVLPILDQLRRGADLDDQLIAQLEAHPFYVLDTRSLDPAFLETALRDVPPVFETGDGPLPSDFQMRHTDGTLCHVPTCRLVHDFPLQPRTHSLPAHEPRGFERARGVLAVPARVGPDARPTWQLEELSADLAAAPVPVISCGVVGHAPDCECATL